MTVTIGDLIKGIGILILVALYVLMWWYSDFSMFVPGAEKVASFVALATFFNIAGHSLLITILPIALWDDIRDIKLFTIPTRQSKYKMTEEERKEFEEWKKLGKPEV